MSVRRPHAPAAANRCPRCGRVVPGTVCAVCDPFGGDNPYAPPLAEEGRRRVRFRLVDLVLGIAVGAVMMSLIRAEPTGGVLVTVVIVPALIRVIVAVRLWRDRGEEVGFGRLVLTIAQSLAISVISMIALVVFFCAACFPVGYATISILGMGGIYVGLVAGLVAAVYLTRKLRLTLWAIDPEPPWRPVSAAGIHFLDSTPAGSGEIHFREFDPLFDRENVSHDAEPKPGPPADGPPVRDPDRPDLRSGG